MKDVFSWKLLALALIFALLSSLYFKVIERKEEEPAREILCSDYQLDLFVEPDDGPGPVIEAIRSGKDKIDLVCYLFSDGRIIDELIKAKERGVKVRVMLEPRPYGDSPVNYKTKKRLEAAGIHFKWASSNFLLTHEKAVIIDKTRALVMTLNLCKSAFKENREYGVVVEDPDIVAEIERIFEADWQGRWYRSRDPNLVVSPENSRRRLIALILGTKQRIWLEQFLLEDREIVETLRGVAKRGVEVKILLASPNKVEGNLAAKGYLEGAGVEVRFLYRPFPHAKLIDSDGKICFVGSQNLSSQSLDLNRELGIFLTDKEGILKLEETFLKDWERAR